MMGSKSQHVPLLSRNNQNKIKNSKSPKTFSLLTFLVLVFAFISTSTFDSMPLLSSTNGNTGMMNNALTVKFVSASRYEIDNYLVAQDWQGLTTEGPMYSLKDFPFGVSGTSFVQFDGTVELSSRAPGVKANFSVIFSSSNSRSNFEGIESLNPCENSGKKLSSDALTAFGTLNQVQSFPVESGQPTKINAKAPVKRSGWQYITFVLCTSADSPAEIRGDLSFRNPYGYLPALLYGFLPFSGILSTLYFLLAGVFAVLCVRYREVLLKLQVFILFVIVLGFVATAAWFFTYTVMNNTGEKSCCPVHSDIIFAIAVNNVKRVVSALLVLCVSLGWGVVKPNLERPTALKVIILGIFYLAFSLNYDMRRVRAPSEGVAEDTQMEWLLPVALCDVFFVFWISSSIRDAMTSLEASQQHAKLEMYQRLSKTLGIWVAIWVIYTLFSIFVNNEVIHLSWKWMFSMFAFRDVLYFGILVSIARIWAPSPTAARYAYSHQRPTTDVLDEFDASALEMNTPKGAAEEASNVSDD